MANQSDPLSLILPTENNDAEELPATAVYVVPDELLPKVPATIYVSRKDLLKQALVKLSQDYYVEDIDSAGNLFICRLTIGLPPYALSHEPSKKTFSYVSTKNVKDCVEKACEIALKHMEKYQLIIVDDFNSSCKRDLLRASTFSDLFQEKVESLQKTLASFTVEHQQLLAQIEDICSNLPSQFSVVVSFSSSANEASQTQDVQYVGPLPASTTNQKIGANLASLWQHLKTIGKFVSA